MLLNLQTNKKNEIKMAKNKKSFLLYCDLIHTVSKMPNDKAGELFKHILEYVNDRNPDTDDLIIQLTFEPIKQQLKRDLAKYHQIKEKRRQAGIASAESRKQNQQVLTNVESVEQKATNLTDNDSANDIEKEINKNNIYVEDGHLSITWNDMNKLIDEFGEEKADTYVNKVLNYRKNAKYKSLYLTALNWIMRDQAKEQANKENPRAKPKLAI